jgi:hypothetical protein
MNTVGIRVPKRQIRQFFSFRVSNALKHTTVLQMI